MSEFKFDPIKHRYTLDGKPITGVTTVLGILSSPWLIQWAADEAVCHLGWFKPEYDKNNEGMSKVSEMLKSIQAMTDEQFYILLSEARTKHIKKRDSAGGIGSKVHKWIENFAADQSLMPDPEISHIITPFVNWVKENNVKFLENELRLYSKQYWYAGTMDLVLDIGGKIFIGDVKTAGSISPRNFFQTAAYQQALQEMGRYPEIEGNIIINTRKDGGFEVQRSYGFETNLKGFLSCLHIYRALEELQVAIEGK